MTDYATFEGMPNGHDPSKVNQTQISNNYPMTADAALVASEWAAMQADTDVYNLARNRVRVNNTLVYDIIPWFGDATTDSSGIATFYLTDTGLSTGTALYPSLTNVGMIAQAYGGNQYQCAKPVVAGNKKSVTVSVIQAVVTLGLLTTPAAGVGVAVSLGTPGNG